jgi:hypothetical protein
MPIMLVVVAAAACLLPDLLSDLLSDLWVGCWCRSRYWVLGTLTHHVIAIMGHGRDESRTPGVRGHGR